MNRTKTTGHALLWFLCLTGVLLSCQPGPSHNRAPGAGQGLDESDRDRLAGGRTLYLKGEHQEALRVLEELYKRKPEDREVCTAYARCLLYSGDPQAVLGVWDALPCELKDSSVDLIRISAEAGILSGRFDKAVALVERGLKLSSEDTALLLLLARCRRREGQYDKALALLETARHLTERDVAIYLEIAKIYSAYGMEEQAEEALECGLVRLPRGHPLAPALYEILNK